MTMFSEKLWRFIRWKARQLEQKSIKFVKGEVEFLSKHKIVIRKSLVEKTVTSKVFVVATGALPIKLDVEGIDTVNNKWDISTVRLKSCRKDCCNWNRTDWNRVSSSLLKTRFRNHYHWFKIPCQRSKRCYKYCSG
mmetsp:Transcript_23894/g.29285  ORF Transcript_23894/g.29285 Transcript_23894/m.29285 type:complete len:136 (-) Transcript_23894:828-1235(-)